MAMKTYDFAYGRGRKTFTVEEDRVLKVVRTEEFPPMEDIRGGVLEAIRHPIGARRSKRSSSPATPSPSSATTRPASPTASTSCRCSSMR